MLSVDLSHTKVQLHISAISLSAHALHPNKYHRSLVFVLYKHILNLSPTDRRQTTIKTGSIETTNEDLLLTTDQHYTLRTKFTGHKQTSKNKDLLLTTIEDKLRTITSPTTQNLPNEITTVTSTSTTSMKQGTEVERECAAVSKPSEVKAWILIATFAIMFFGLLTVNIIGACILYHRKRCKSENGAQVSQYVLDSNPCYEASNVTHATESKLQDNVYEAI